MSATTGNGGTGEGAAGERGVLVAEQWLAGEGGAAFVEAPLSPARVRELAASAGATLLDTNADGLGTGVDVRGGTNGTVAVSSAAIAPVTLEVPGVVGLLTVRADPAHAPLAEAFDTVLGLALPDRLHVTSADGRRLRWLSPDEWLLSCAVEEAADVERRLRAALGDAPRVAITNVTAAWCALVLGGEGARAVLARGVPIDVDPRAFPDGRVASTVLAKANATLANLGDGRYEILCRRSFAEYVARWLGSASRGAALAVSGAAPC